jgi:hypothetical protein
LLHLERNEACLCGSGRKYKKCCLRRVEEAEASIRRSVRIPFPAQASAVSELLGVAVGLAGDAQDRPLALEKAIEAVSRLADALGGDSGPDENGLAALHDDLLEALGSHPELKMVRYDPDDLLREAAEARGKAGAGEETSATGPAPSPEDEGPGEVEEVAAEVVRRLWSPELAEDFSFSLLAALRGEPTPDQTAGIVWGAWCLADSCPPSENPFWLAVFDATVEDLFQTTKKLKAMQKEGAGADQWVEGLAAVLREHPIMDRRLSRWILEETAEALDALREGRLKLSFPAWAMLGGLRLMVGHMEAFKARVLESLDSGGSTGTSPDGPRDRPVLLGTLSQRDMARELMAVAEDLDWEPVVSLAVPAVHEFATGEDVPASLRDSAEALAMHLTYYLTTAQHLIYHILYGRAMLDLSESDELPTGLPEGHPFTLKLADVLDEAKLTEYAAALEKAGEKEAAEHVRQVAASQSTSVATEK